MKHGKEADFGKDRYDTQRTISNNTDLENKLEITVALVLLTFSRKWCL